MNFDLNKLELLMQSKSENEHVEFKEAKTSFSYDRTLEYCVALANEGGGYLMLGITDTAPRMVSGSLAFPNREKIAEQIFQKLGFRVDVHELTHQDGRVVVFEVPSRPQGTPLHVDGKYLMRVGESLQAMTPEVIIAITKEGQPNFLEQVALSAVDIANVMRLLDTDAYYELLNKPNPSSPQEILRNFVMEGFLIRSGDCFDITNLGAVLFAKSLKKFPALLFKAPRLIVYNGKNKLGGARHDIEGKNGYVRGFIRLMEFLETVIPVSEVIEKDVRKVTPQFPIVAIRELVANALIHQDFLVTGTRVMIELYTDRLEISNPGQPNIETDRFIDEVRSRNEKLANVMMRLGICEARGSGIDRVIDLSEQWQLLPPDFRAAQDRTIATLYEQRPFAELTKDERIRACYQHCVLRYVFHEVMNNKSLRKRFGLPDDKAERASKVIADTLDEGLIKDKDPEGSRKYKRYVPFWG